MATGLTPLTPSSPFSAREKSNHTRLSRLLIDIGRRVLQDVFDSIHPPSSLHGVLNSAPIKNQLQRLRSRKFLFDNQWNTLYPSSGIAESKNFDVTLLFRLMTNICGLRPPTSTGSWSKEPLPSDLSMEADLVRIKQCRNELCHAVEMALTDDKFENSWDETEAVLNRLGRSKYKNQIENLKFASLDPEKDTGFYALLQAWEEDEGVIRTITEEVQKMHEKIDVLSDKMRNLNGGESRASEEVKLFTAKLKEAVIKQTDMQQKGIINAESVKTDDIFTNLVVHHQNIPQQGNVGGQRERKTITEIKKCSEIFIEEGDGKHPKRILVSGEPGIGKTMFSQKLVRDLAAMNISIPSIEVTYFITFRQLSELGDKLIDLRELLNLCPLLDDTSMIKEREEAVMEYLSQNSAHLLIVFDGLDEFNDRSQIFSDVEIRHPNCAKTKMPVAALVSKLIQKKILRDSVIMVTSRPREANEFSQKIHCDRFVQIKGFSASQVVGYVQKYFSSKPEEIKIKALDKVLGSEHYMSFGRIPFKCYLMCIYIEWEIASKRNNSAPATLTEFYSQVIYCIERNYNKAIRSLQEKKAQLFVDKTLENFAQLAAYLNQQDKFSFTRKDLEKLKLSENESLQIISSNLIFCSPVSSNSPFQNPTYEYSFTHLTIQEFFVGWYFAKMVRALPKQETSEMVHLFISGLLGLEETEQNNNLMLEVVKCIRSHPTRVRLLSLRCLYEYGQDKELTTQQLTTNPDHTYWYSDGRIEMYFLTDSDCSPVAMLLEKSSTASLSSPPHRLSIDKSSLTCYGLKRLFSSLAEPTCAITDLKLLSCQLDDGCVEALCTNLPKTKITALSLGKNLITDSGVQCILDHYPRQLTKLTLGFPCAAFESQDRKIV